MPRVENGVPISGTGRILVVDDEEVVRNMLGDMHAILGYQVTTADNGEEVVEIDLAYIDEIASETFRTVRPT